MQRARLAHEVMGPLRWVPVLDHHSYTSATSIVSVSVALFTSNGDPYYRTNSANPGSSRSGREETREEGAHRSAACDQAPRVESDPFIIDVIGPHGGEVYNSLACKAGNVNCTDVVRDTLSRYNPSIFASQNLRARPHNL